MTESNFNANVSSRNITKAFVPRWRPTSTINGLAAVRVETGMDDTILLALTRECGQQIANVLNHLEQQIFELEQRIDNVAVNERKACAKIADDYDGEGYCSAGYYAQLGDGPAVAQGIRDLIMARGAAANP